MRITHRLGTVIQYFVRKPLDVLLKNVKKTHTELTVALQKYWCRMNANSRKPLHSYACYEMISNLLQNQLYVQPIRFSLFTHLVFLLFLQNLLHLLSHPSTDTLKHTVSDIIQVTKTGCTKRQEEDTTSMFLLTSDKTVLIDWNLHNSVQKPLHNSPLCSSNYI